MVDVLVKLIKIVGVTGDGGVDVKFATGTTSLITVIVFVAIHP